MLAYRARPSGAKWAQTVNGFRSVGRENLNNRQSPILGPRHPARLGEPTNTPVRSPQHTASCCSCCLMHARVPSQAIRCKTGANGDRSRVGRSRKFEKIANPRFSGPAAPTEPSNTPVRSPQHPARCCSCCLMHARVPTQAIRCQTGANGDRWPVGRSRKFEKIANPRFWARGTPHGSVNPQTRPCDHCNTRLILLQLLLDACSRTRPGDPVPNGRERGSVTGRSFAKI
jgi:hypothetical protein